ncbi:MAG: DUF3100 domain-containing protein [Oscillospiraceae bacterium]|jgi:hypothetical protein|nr:DUF3100 domain-containing protein [Oscillospiraceae bacterium]
MKDFKENFNLKDWKVHVLCFVIMVIAELIGTIKITMNGARGGGISFSLIPMLFAILIGIILGGAKKIKKETMITASPYISICVMFLIVKLSCSIGPSWSKIVAAGPALILQEFGNLGTIIFSMPLAVLVFRMGRASIGAAFSISREPSIAIVAERYGLDGPEGSGVMGAYVTGTVLGTVFYGILASIFVGLKWFHPYSLAMAAGMGSASMLTAAMAPLVEAFPDLAEDIQAFAVTSNTLTNADGLYMSLLIGLPLTEWLYKVFSKNHPQKGVESLDEASDIVVEKEDM